MEAYDPGTVKGPEWIIQEKIMKMLRLKGWWVKRIHGNMYQGGLPDLYASHRVYGVRWIEVKLPSMKGSKFTRAQLETFPEMCKNGSGVWVLTGDSKEEYKKLFSKHNWWSYCKIWR